MIKIAVLLLVAFVPFISCVGRKRVGGQSHFTTTLDNPNVVLAVQSINSYYSRLGDNNLRTAVQLVDATSQVVSGIMYRFTIQVSGGAAVEKCTVTVWSRPWKSASEATIVEGDPVCVPAA